MAPAPVLARIDLSANRSGESSAEADVQKEGLVAYLDDVIEALGMDEGTTEEETITEINRLVDLATAPVEPESRLPAGVQAVDANVFAQLQADAAAGREALEAQAEARREGIVKAAMADGRITAASKATWLSALEKDEEGAKALIESFPKNTIPVAEIGHSDDIQTAEDALLDRFNGKTQEV